MQTRSKYIEQLEELESCVRRLSGEDGRRRAGRALPSPAMRMPAEGVFRDVRRARRLQSAIHAHAATAGGR